MKGLSAVLTFFNLATISALLLGIVARGLGPTTAWISLALGFAGAVAAYLSTTDPDGTFPKPNGESVRYRWVPFWILVAIFAMFAFRSFCWLLYIDGDQLMIQSPNNLGDLALHITYIKDFANGTPLWPPNPIYLKGALRYPAGADLFNGVLCLARVDLIVGLVWVGLLASVATCYALFRWAGLFGIAGFLFNGGVAGFAFLTTRDLIDYQGDKTIAWKSLPLSMFVTQRGLLYAIPAGLLLLWQWRERYFRKPGARPPLPFWVELSLYASMPLFHVHTFLALSIVLACLFLLGDPPMRGQLLTLVIAAFLPATFFVWLITDHLHAGSIVQWHPGWVMKDHDFGRSSFILFWWDNFGIFGPLALALFGFCGWRAWKTNFSRGQAVSEEIAFLLPALLIIALALLVKLAPWEWDNLKVMIWAYFIILSYLGLELVRHVPLPPRLALCILLFGSGFVSLFGGLAAGRPGFGFASRAEVDGVGEATQNLPLDARFAAYPTYNHPLLLQGRNLVLGYAGHLWTQGFSEYGKINDQLNDLMLGKTDWETAGKELGVRYIFWGREEKQNYKTSTRPWENVLTPIKTGEWGALYDLEQSPPGN